MTFYTMLNGGKTQCFPFSQKSFQVFVYSAPFSFDSASAQLPGAGPPEAVLGWQLGRRMPLTH